MYIQRYRVAYIFAILLVLIIHVYSLFYVQTTTEKKWLFKEERRRRIIGKLRALKQTSNEQQIWRDMKNTQYFNELKRSSHVNWDMIRDTLTNYYRNFLNVANYIWVIPMNYNTTILSSGAFGIVTCVYICVYLWRWISMCEFVCCL